MTEDGILLIKDQTDASIGKYNEVKPSDIVWLGEVPGHWEIMRLKNLIYLNPSKKEVDRVPKTTSVTFLPMESVSEAGEIDLSKSKEIKDVESGYTYFRDGDVILAKITPCFENGKAAVVENLKNKIGFGSTEFHVLRVKDQISNRFIFYLIQSHAFKKIGEANMIGSAGQKRVPESFILNYRQAFPSPKDQKAIADFLDRETGKLDRLVEKKERLIELLREKRQALITQAVTKGLNPNVPMKDSGIEWLGEVPEHWKVLKIKWLSKVKRGASPRPIEDPIYFDNNGEYAWVRIADVTSSNMYLKKTSQTLSELGASLSVKLPPGKLFLSIAGSVGKPCISGIKCCIHDGFVYFPDLQENEKFFYYVFASGAPYGGLGKLGTQLNLNTDIVGDIYTGVPEIKEQLEIVKYLDNQTSKIDTLISKLQIQITKIKEYRQALISSAVTGKIDVREKVRA
ncbi:restriction endonuclease subunit S [Kroppenstedtia eburnea]|uniref:restriction endonuclease subunit S n=1 Tax=Kroppenstedtia eburnea TaxID=714067 RepID=UPI0036432B66